MGFVCMEQEPRYVNETSDAITAEFLLRMSNT